MTNKSFNLTMTGIVIVSIIAALLLTGFSGKLTDSKTDNTNSEEAAIVGTWLNSEGSDGLSITFDKKKKSEENAQFEILGTSAGTYTVSDGLLTLNYNNDELWGGKTVTYQYSLSDDNLILNMTETTTGNTISYVRQDT